MPVTALTASIEVPPGQSGPADFQVVLRVANSSTEPATILNPEMGAPQPQWPYSPEAHQAATLMSFGYLSLSLTDAAGAEVKPEAIQTWATPALRSPVELAPGQTMDLAIPIGTFYALTPGTYQLAVSYGEAATKVSAEAAVTVG